MNATEAKSKLEQAIKLHAAHMDGSEPTSEESQERLMDLLEDALESLSSMGDMHEDREEENDIQSIAMMME